MLCTKHGVPASQNQEHPNIMFKGPTWVQQSQYCNREKKTTLQRELLDLTTSKLSVVETGEVRTSICQTCGGYLVK